MRPSTSIMRPFLRASFTEASAPRHAFSTSAARSGARIIITGRLGHEPEVQASSTGNEYVKYTVASSSGPRDNRQTSWFRIASFVPEGPARDFILGLPKGTLVCVDGEAQLRQYDDADGKKQTAINIREKSIEVLKRPDAKPEE